MGLARLSSQKEGGHCTGPSALRALCLAECSAVTVFKFLIIHMQSVPIFHCAQDLPNYVADPAIENNEGEK